MKLSELGEFGFIKRIVSGCIRDGGHVIRGIGDDCAVMRPESGTRLRLLTTDMLVEGVHFRLHDMSPHQLGAKAMAVNLSDIAAMGGWPQDAFISLAVPPDITVDYLEALYGGIKAMAAHYSVNLLGGDTTACPHGLILNIAITGTVEQEEVLLRSGAQVGDVIYVTGSLGDCAAGLDALLSQRGTASTHPQHHDPPAPDSPEVIVEVVRELIRRHQEPLPHLAQGQHIATSKKAHAMIDVSDGLVADLGHICDQSKVGCRLDARCLPLSSELSRYCAHYQLEALDFALSGGEDYVLLLTGPPDLAQQIPKESCLTAIGQIIAGRQRTWMNARGEEQPLFALGWDHFRTAR